MMKMEEKISILEEIISTGLTPKVFATWFVLHILLFTVVNVWCLGNIKMTTWIPATRLGIPTYPPWGFYFLFLVIVTLLSVTVSKKFYFTTQELTILFAMMFLSLDTAIMLSMVVSASWAYFDPALSAVRDFIPSFWTVKDYEVIKTSSLGGATVPWGPLIPVISFWIVFYLAKLLVQLFTMEIFREKWIEIERMPFVGMIPTRFLIETSTIPSESRWPTLFRLRLNKFFYIGFLVGFLYGIPLALQYIFPWILGYAIHVMGRTQIWPLRDFLDKNPWHIVGDSRFVACDAAILYLLPMDVLLTQVLFQIGAYIIWPLVGTATGIMLPGVSGWSYLYTEGPFRPRFVAHFAIVTGLGIWGTVFAYKYLKSDLAKAFRRKLAETSKDTIPRIWAWGGFFASWIIMIALGVAMGVPAILSIFVCLMFFIWMVGYVIGVGEAWGIFQLLGENSVIPATTRAFAATVGYIPATAVLSQESVSLGAFMVSLNNYEGQHIGGAMVNAANYKLANMTKTSQKTMFISMLIASMIIAVVSVPIAFSLMYTWGVETRLSWFGPKGTIGSVRIPTFLREGITYDLQIGSFAWDATGWAHFFGGIIIVGIMLAMRLKFPWFFLNPAGLVTGYVFYYVQNGLTPLILKYITIKIGGAKGYENIGVPVCVGFLVGETFMAVIGMITLHVRSIMV